MPSATMSKASASASATALTKISYTAFVPIGIANVILAPMLPVLSARWSLDYSQAGALFTAQYITSTCAVALSGAFVSFRGFRFAIKTGLILIAVALLLLFAGQKTLGIFCIATIGAGLGIAVPAANLLVAELNPDRRSATLNWLNFCWSAGAVACPFLVAFAAKAHHMQLFLGAVSFTLLAVAVAIALMPASVVEPSVRREEQPKVLPAVRTRLMPFLILAALFFLYVGTENGFGGWVASYAKSLGNLSPAMSLITPSFFYAALMFGRSLAPWVLKNSDEVKLVQVGLILASAGTAGLLLSHGLIGVLSSACAAGLGLSYVYPITISLLSKEFGPASPRIGSLMFVLSNIGGGLLPWIVGLSATRFETLRAGLYVPLLGCVAMFLLYLRYSMARPSEQFS